MFPINVKKFGGEGAYAVVTGASDGIGKEYAKQLGKKGLNLVLIARNLKKLEKVKNEIESSCSNSKSKKVDIKIIVTDFSSSDDEIYGLVLD